MEGAAIPDTFTCDGANINPPLIISGVPKGTASLALILEDPDAPAGTFTHWVLFNIPATASRIEEGEGDGQGTTGKNSAGESAYAGPCPPSGVHRYIFSLYALDRPLSLPDGAAKDEVIDAMKGAVIGMAELSGVYGRSS
jgi:hypothetical protein